MNDPILDRYIYRALAQCFVITGVTHTACALCANVYVLSTTPLCRRRSSRVTLLVSRITTFFAGRISRMTLRRHLSRVESLRRAYEQSSLFFPPFGRIERYHRRLVPFARDLSLRCLFSPASTLIGISASLTFCRSLMFMIPFFFVFAAKLVF